MSETSSTTLPASHSETVTQLAQQPVITNDQSKPSASPTGKDKEVLVDDDGEEYEIEYEYEDDDDDVNREKDYSGDEEDEEYYRIANRIDELLDKASDLRDEVSVSKTFPSLNNSEILQTESSQSASGDADDEYEYEYEYEDEDEEEPLSEGDSKNDQITKQTIDPKNSSLASPLTKELPASQAITQSPFQEELPDFGQLRHASNKWNIAAISGEDAEMNFDDDDEECNEIEIALEEPAAKIVGQLEQLLEEDEQDEVDELMPDALIQQTNTSNPLLLGAIDLPVTPSPVPSPLLCQSGSSTNSGCDLLQQVRSAALNNELDALCTLLNDNPGFFIDAILKAGWTALMYGSYRSNVDIVDECLARGADPNYHKECFTPLMAVCCSRMEICDYIPYAFSADARMLATLRLLIEAGGSVHSQDKFGCTALQYASRFGRRLLVNALLDSGAHVDVRNCNGWTALHWASAEGHNDVVETLLSRGADPNLKTTDPEALSPGEMAFMKGHEQIADQILNATFSDEVTLKSTLKVQTYPLRSNNEVGCDLMDVQSKNESVEQQQKTLTNQPIGLEIDEKETEVQNKLNNNQSEPEVQIQYENEQIICKKEEKDPKFNENISEGEKIKEEERREKKEEPEVEEYIRNSGTNLSVESELADSLLRSAIDSASFELSLKQIQESASARLDSLSGPELRKRTTLVIDEWDEDTKRALANQTEQRHRRSSTTALTEGRSLVLSLIIAALLFLLFRTLFGAIFS